MHVEAQQEHRWLHRLVGEWNYEIEAAMGPDKPVEKFRGTEVVRSLGGVWVICEGRGDTPGGAEPGITMMTLGYDVAKRRFVGTFIGSMMTNLWVYDGELDAAGNKLTLDAEGPSFTGDGKTALFKDAIEFKNDDERVLTSHMLGDDGNWHGFMTATYRRKK